MASAPFAPTWATQSSLIRAGQAELPEDVAMRNHLTGTNFGASIQNGASIAFGKRVHHRPARIMPHDRPGYSPGTPEIAGPRAARLLESDRSAHAKDHGSPKPSSSAYCIVFGNAIA